LLATNKIDQPPFEGAKKKDIKKSKKDEETKKDGKFDKSPKEEGDSTIPSEPQAATKHPAANKALPFLPLKGTATRLGGGKKE
jgi:hypothetical protein